jgi:hypothetical protein
VLNRVHCATAESLTDLRAHGKRIFERKESVASIKCRGYVNMGQIMPVRFADKTAKWV